jgi:uncharacterized delta-60 repeat protein
MRTLRLLIPARRRALLAATVALLAPPLATASAAGPSVSVAPGRAVFAVGGAAVESDPDASGVDDVVALPDGGALLLGTGSPRGRTLYVAKIGREGALDRAFGDGGVAKIALAGGGSLGQALLQPDGRLLLVTFGVVSGSNAPPQATVMRVNADMTPDRSFGDGGAVATPIGSGSAALQPDGAIVVAGTTGDYGTLKRQPTLHPTVVRLTPSGQLDSSFGAGGVATIPTPISTSSSTLAVGPDGTIVVEGYAQVDTLLPVGHLVLARLTVDGALDPAFGGGAPVTLPFANGSAMLVLEDGSLVLAGEPPRAPSSTIAEQLAPSRQLLARYTPAGTPDPTFGAGGFVDLGLQTLPQQLLALPDRAVEIIGSPANSLLPGSLSRYGQFDVRRVDARGTTTTNASAVLPFGGGGSSFIVSVRPRPVGSIVQNSVAGLVVAPRADGSFLAAGGVHVSQPTGEGTGFSIGRFAVAAVTPSLALDPAFGGPAAPLSVSLRAVRQRATTTRTRHGVRIALRASAEGLAAVRVRAGGQLIAHSLLPVFDTTRRVLPVELTHAGNSYLRRHRHGVRVTITATARDLLTNTSAATIRTMLR